MLATWPWWLWGLGWGHGAHMDPSLFLEASPAKWGWSLRRPGLGLASSFAELSSHHAGHKEVVSSPSHQLVIPLCPGWAGFPAPRQAGSQVLGKGHRMPMAGVAWSLMGSGSRLGSGKAQESREGAAFPLSPLPWNSPAPYLSPPHLYTSPTSTSKTGLV